MLYVSTRRLKNTNFLFFDTLYITPSFLSVVSPVLQEGRVVDVYLALDNSLEMVLVPGAFSFISFEQQNPVSFFKPKIFTKFVLFILTLHIYGFTKMKALCIHYVAHVSQY